MIDAVLTFIRNNEKDSMSPGQLSLYGFNYNHTQYTLRVRCIAGLFRVYSLWIEDECLCNSSTIDGFIYELDKLHLI